MSIKLWMALGCQIQSKGEPWNSRQRSLSDVRIIQRHSCGTSTTSTHGRMSTQGRMAALRHQCGYRQLATNAPLAGVNSQSKDNASGASGQAGDGTVGRKGSALRPAPVKRRRWMPRYPRSTSNRAAGCSTRLSRTPVASQLFMVNLSRRRPLLLSQVA